MKLNHDIIILLIQHICPLHPFRLDHTVINTPHMGAWVNNCISFVGNY